MAHHITDQDTMIWNCETPWHGLGIDVGHDLTVQQAIEAAKLDWTVSKQPLFLADSTPMPMAFAMRREDTGALLSVVGPQYTPIQNAEAFSLVEAIVGQHAAYTHTAGSLDGGQRVWMLLKMPEDIIACDGRDRLEQYLLVITSHDQSYATRCMMTSVRVVCQNTLNMADSAHRNGLKIKHTKSAHDRIDQAKSILAQARASSNAFKEMVTYLSKTKFTKSQMIELAHQLYPVKATKAEVMLSKINLSNSIEALESLVSDISNLSERDLPALRGAFRAKRSFLTTPKSGIPIEAVLPQYGKPTIQEVMPDLDTRITKQDEKRDELIDLFINGRGQELCQGTAWAALNAVTEHTDWGGFHSTRTTPDDRLSSIWTGKAETVKMEAQDMILDLCKQHSDR